MITEKQWEHIKPWRQKQLIVSHTIIIDNKYGIKPGYYCDEDIVGLLRKYKNSPEAIQFLTDML